MALLELTGVTKRFGGVTAIQELSLSLEARRTGLLGPNGAGKTTLFKLILGLVAPDEGVVSVFGRSVQSAPLALRARIGFMTEGDGVVPDLTALGFVALSAELSGLPRSEALGRAHQMLEYVGLGEARYRKLAGFSTGMRQRAKLAQALVGDPELLLLDEPTSGLDPDGRADMLRLVREVPEKTGASIVLSTHILSDIERTCEDVILLSAGRLLYGGRTEDLLNLDSGQYEVRVKGEAGLLRPALEERGCKVIMESPVLRILLPPDADPRIVLEAAGSSGVQVRHLAPVRATLDEAFMNVTNVTM